MSSSKFQHAIELPLSLPRPTESGASSPRAEDEVLSLFDECAAGLRRYLASFGLGAAADEIHQDVFVALYRHLNLGRPRGNLRGWLFRVGHNLALKQRRRSAVRQQSEWAWDDARAAQLIDPQANPEERLVTDERRDRLLSVIRALPERDRQCLTLRAEGLRYRDIAATLGISLGSVAKSLARAMTRLANAERE